MQQLLRDTGTQNATAIHGDVRDPTSILAATETQSLIDFTQPIGLLMVALLHFVEPEANPLKLVREFQHALPPGSYFAASHVAADEAPADARAQLEALEREYRWTANPATLRTRAQFAEFFVGLELPPPGISYGVAWRPTDEVDPDDPARRRIYAAVGRKS